jgi:hypothetical protein
MHNRWSGSRLFVSGLVCLTVLAAPAVARAGDGVFGVGARFSLVRGDAAVPGSSADRFSGGLLRLRLSPRTAIEVALDYRSYLNQDLTERIKDMPIQASMLLYPIRAAISPYLLGGVGWYAQTVTLVNTDAPPTPQTTRTMGYHAGAGGELRLGAHAAVHLDYRYTFIHFGSDQAGAASSSTPGALPIPGLGALQDRLRLSHKGSMWTGGVTFYF